MKPKPIHKRLSSGGLKSLLTLFTFLTFFRLLWGGPLAAQTMHHPAEISKALARYDYFILHTNPDTLATLFAPLGDLGTMAHGRDSIRKFLLKFKNIRVLSTASTSESIKMAGDTAYQEGTYRQTAIIPPHDTLHVHGRIMIHWVFDKPGTWLIQRLNTQPGQ